MRAGLVFVLVSLLAGSAFREWKRANEPRFADLVAELEARNPAVERDPRPPNARGPALTPARLDVDRATARELERLPGIGPALAARIVADRTAHGPFGSPEAIVRVSGIGPRTLSRIRPYLQPAPSPADSSSPIAN